ncbi:sensor histidine kinase LiaS [Paraliobacillus ryukyuensis]|uniref:Sensor histidine kinase n=1 Tax=Paraliobacillus ryukyuensis TaxID=200904 RepID=A0A366E783_9BACI|nr:sensor histidine kinase [Paraliobacillus ryukyuensis]RBO98250.1 NarL family two-component system sensor histidine kinase LiaS [Paraliobacillus ryukyuensis]
MLNRLNSIRYTYIRAHLYALFLTLITLLAFLLTIHVLFSPTWLTSISIFVFILAYVVIAFIFSIYSGFKASSDTKTRVDYLSVLIAQLARGNYTTRIYDIGEDEIGRIGDELNELGEKMQGQVRSLQRLADEKSEYAKSAHKAATIEERQRLARDLHDAVSQQLFALTMMSEATVRVVDKHPEKAKKQIKEIAMTAKQAQTEMRALLLHLRPVHLSGDSLSIGIKQLVNELEQKCSINFQMHIDPFDRLSQTTEEHVFRIVQEALSNILRHSEATEVTIDIKKYQQEFFLHIADNGKGIDLFADHQKIASYGLKTMKERAEEIGGTFSIRSKLEEGTHIDIRIPLQIGEEE